MHVGAAWLSSARAVRCRLKCHNERNPFRRLPSGHAGDSGGTAAARREEGGDDVKSARPLRPGPHTCYNGGHSELDQGDLVRIMKSPPSSDRSLQPDSAKPDSLVIAHQPWRGEYVPGPCTHRPSSHESLGRLKEGAAGTPPFWRILKGVHDAARRKPSRSRNTSFLESGRLSCQRFVK